MIFTKGKARCMRLDSKKIKKDGRIHYMSGAARMLPAMFDVEPVPRNQKIHQSELPVELCEQLIPYLTREGEVILDQFAGSGAVGVAALRLGRRCIMIEKSHEDNGTDSETGRVRWLSFNRVHLFLLFIKQGFA